MSYNDCLNEVLKDENGNKITPDCGMEKLLSEICRAIDSISNDPSTITFMTNEDIDEITSM